MTNENEIIWTGPIGPDDHKRVVRIAGEQPGTDGLLVETRELDSQKAERWTETDDRLDRTEAIAVAACALHDRVKVAEAGLDRLATVAENNLEDFTRERRDARNAPKHDETAQQIKRAYHRDLQDAVGQNGEWSDLLLIVRDWGKTADDEETMRRKLGGALMMVGKPEAPTWDELLEYAGKRTHAASTQHIELREALGITSRPTWSDMIEEVRRHAQRCEAFEVDPAKTAAPGQLEDFARGADEVDARRREAEAMGSWSYREVTEAIEAEFTACHRELRDALELSGPVTWDQLLEKVRSLASDAKHEAELERRVEAARTETPGADRCQSTYRDQIWAKPLPCSLAAGHVGDHEHSFSLAGYAPFTWRASGQAAPDTPESLDPMSIDDKVSTAPGELASLRAELTALGKHVEDVEKRAYASVDVAAFGALRDRVIETAVALEGRLADVEARIGQPGPLDKLESKVDAAIELGAKRWGDLGAKVDQALADGTARGAEIRARIDALENTTAGKAETLEAVRSLTDAIAALSKQVETDDAVRVDQIEALSKAHEAIEGKAQQLEGMCVGLRSRCGAIEQDAANFRDLLTGKVAECFDRVDNVVRMIGDMREQGLVIEGPCKRCGATFNRRQTEAARFPEPYRHECGPCLARLVKEAVDIIVSARRACRAATCQDPEAKDDMRAVAETLGFDIDAPEAPGE